MIVIYIIILLIRKKVLGSIRISRSFYVGALADYGKRQNIFGISLPNRTYVIQCATKKERSEWLNSINNVMYNKLRNTRSKTRHSRTNTICLASNGITQAPKRQLRKNSYAHSFEIYNSSSSSENLSDVLSSCLHCIDETEWMPFKVRELLKLMLEIYDDIPLYCIDKRKCLSYINDGDDDDGDDDHDDVELSDSSSSSSTHTNQMNSIITWEPHECYILCIQFQVKYSMKLIGIHLNCRTENSKIQGIFRAFSISKSNRVKPIHNKVHKTLSSSSSSSIMTKGVQLTWTNQFTLTPGHLYCVGISMTHPIYLQSNYLLDDQFQNGILDATWVYSTKDLCKRYRRNDHWVPPLSLCCKSN